MEPEPTRPLSISDKISIVTALMAHDRNEVQRHQEELLRLSYLMVPGFVTVAAFANANPSLKNVLMIGQLLLLALYLVVSLVTLLKSVPDARACLTKREEYFEDGQSLLGEEPFNPLLGPKENHYRKSYLDLYLWLPFALTVVAGGVMLSFMWWYVGLTVPLPAARPS